MPKPHEILAFNLERLIKTSGQKQNEVAAAVDVSPTYLNQILKGTNRNPSLEKLELLADHFGLGLWELFKPANAEADHPLTECARRVSDAAAAVEAGNVVPTQTPREKYENAILTMAELFRKGRAPEWEAFLQSLVAPEKKKTPQG